MITTVAVLATLAIGLAAGWALRGVASWCPDCGDQKQCRRCDTEPPTLDWQTADRTGKGCDR